MKAQYQFAPILMGVNWSLEFNIHTKASDITLGAMLVESTNQAHIGRIDQPSADYICLLNKTEK